MLRRNIDFFAVLVIALAVLAFSQAGAWSPFDTLDSIQVGNAIHVESCSSPQGILSHLSYILNQ